MLFFANSGVQNMAKKQKSQKNCSFLLKVNITVGNKNCRKNCYDDITISKRIDIKYNKNIRKANTNYF